MYSFEDEKYIKRCFELAAKGGSGVSPNPRVGAVIVKNGKIIGEGFHQYSGGPHAEVNAFDNCTSDTVGAELYVNLEPCSHTDKKTPPCAPLIIGKNISRLIISNTDPNPKVNGKGVDMIRNSGIRVTTGILEDDGKELNKFFFKYIKSQTPYVTLKIASSADGFITKKKGIQTWITGLKAKQFVHSLRAEYDALLIGAGTVNIDNPLLNVREIKGRNPVRIILDSKLSVNPKSKIFLTANKQRTILFTGGNSDENICRLLENSGVKVIKMQVNKQGLLDIEEVLRILGGMKLSSLLVEGGADIFSQFVQKKLADEIIWIKSPIYFNEGIPALKINLDDSLIKDILPLDKDKAFMYKFRINV